MFALPTLAVLVLHASAVQIGLLAAFQTLPFPILGMVAGVVADRTSRRRIMIAADVVRFLVLSLIPLAAAGGELSMTLLYCIGLVTGTASAFFGIAYQAYLPVLVTPERLTEANARLEFSNSGSAMVGIATAGALVQWVGAAFAIAADAVSYLASIFSLLAIRAPEQIERPAPLTLGQAMREIGDGLGVVFKSEDLRWILPIACSICSPACSASSTASRMWASSAPCLQSACATGWVYVRRSSAHCSSPALRPCAFCWPEFPRRTLCYSRKVQYGR